MDRTLKKKPEGIFVISYFFVKFDRKTNENVKIVQFWNFRGVDRKFLNYEVKIEKALKFHGLKMNFFQIYIGLVR